MAVFWVAAPIISLMEAARTSETLVNFYQTTRRYNPEDSHIRTHRRENLKFAILVFILWCSLLFAFYTVLLLLYAPRRGPNHFSTL
jgi:Trk-type K+ transport system membrane component